MKYKQLIFFGSKWRSNTVAFVSNRIWVWLMGVLRLMIFVFSCGHCTCDATFCRCVLFSAQPRKDGSESKCCKIDWQQGISVRKLDFIKMDRTWSVLFMEWVRNSEMAYILIVYNSVTTEKVCTECEIYSSRSDVCSANQGFTKPAGMKWHRTIPSQVSVLNPGGRDKISSEEHHKFL